MSEIAPRDRRSTGFQSHPERIRVKRRRVPPSASSFTEVMRKSRREVTRKGDFGSFILLSCLAVRCVLAKSRQPILRRAQARGGEAEKL